MRFEKNIVKKLQSDDIKGKDGVLTYLDSDFVRHQLCQYTGSHPVGVEVNYDNCGVVRRFVHIKETWNASRMFNDGTINWQGETSEDIFIGRFDLEVGNLFCFIPTGYISNRNNCEIDAMNLARELCCVYAPAPMSTVVYNKSTQKFGSLVPSFVRNIMNYSKGVMHSHCKTVPSWVYYNKEVSASRTFTVSLYDLYKYCYDKPIEIFTDIEVKYNESSREYVVVEDYKVGLGGKNTYFGRLAKQAIVNLVSEFQSYCGNNCGKWNLSRTTVEHPFSDNGCSKGMSDEVNFCGKCVPEKLVGPVFWNVNERKEQEDEDEENQEEKQRKKQKI